MRYSEAAHLVAIVIRVRHGMFCRGGLAATITNNNHSFGATTPHRYLQNTRTIQTFLDQLLSDVPAIRKRFLHTT